MLQHASLHTRGGVEVRSGQTFCVSPDGDDSLVIDGSELRPWKSLSYATRRVKNAGSTIVIHAGDYVDNSQCVLAPGIKVKGDGRKKVTICDNP